jgi:translocation and assembly module TamA
LRFLLASLAFLFLTGLLSASAHALEVEVDAPKELKPLLEQHLETARAARAQDALTEEEFARLHQASLATARELLATEGYFSPRITASIQGAGAQQTVRYAVAAGPRTLIGTLDIRIEGAFADADKQDARSARLRARIERDFILKPGMPFRQVDWDASKNTALRPLLRSRYPAARLADSKARVDPATQRADLLLVIDSGPAFFYGPVRISGNQRYPVAIIEALNPVDPGEPFRQQDLLDYQQALDASGYFSQAIVRIDPDPALAAAVPIEVIVTERKEKLVSLGLGYSTDNGARAQVIYQDRDILDDGKRLKLDVKLEGNERSGLAELAWPRTHDGYENRMAVEYQLEDIESQETDAWKAVVARNRKRGRIDSTLSLQFQTEQQSVAGTTLSEDNQALSLNYSWTYRTSGRAFYPVRGYVSTLQTGVAAEALLSETSFLRLYGRHTHFFRLGEQGRLVLRGELGHVFADRREGIPTDFLFRAGGENSVRGYEYESLGLDAAGAVISVRSLATASVEYNYFFTPTWGIAVFVDAGDAADSFDQLSVAVGTGVGARYKSPIGPVNVDLAYGEQTGEFRLHLALGVEF